MIAIYQSQPWKLLAYSRRLVFNSQLKKKLNYVLNQKVTVMNHSQKFQVVLIYLVRLLVLQNQLLDIFTN